MVDAVLFLQGLDGLLGPADAALPAGEGLGDEDARLARFRSAAEMVGMWRGLDLPAWISPYASGTPAWDT